MRTGSEMQLGWGSDSRPDIVAGQRAHTIDPASRTECLLLLGIEVRAGVASNRDAADHASARGGADRALRGASIDELAGRSNVAEAAQQKRHALSVRLADTTSLTFPAAVDKRQPQPTVRNRARNVPLLGDSGSGPRRGSESGRFCR